MKFTPQRPLAALGPISCLDEFARHQLADTMLRSMAVRGALGRASVSRVASTPVAGRPCAVVAIRCTGFATDTRDTANRNHRVELLNQAMLGGDNTSKGMATSSSMVAVDGAKDAALPMRCPFARPWAPRL